MRFSRFILVTFLSLSILGISTGQSNDLPSRGSRRRQRNRQSPRRGNRGGSLPEDLEGAYNAAASDVTTTLSTPTTTAPPQEEERSMSADNPWHRFIPSTPTASEVECFVEVHMVRRHGGRCTRLDGLARTAICQSGVHFSFDHFCEQLLTDREDLQNEGSTPPPVK